MLGFFTSVRYAPILGALILTREDDGFDPDNPSSMLKTIGLNDVADSEYNEFLSELRITYRDEERLLTIHIPLQKEDITPEMREALQFSMM
ncbi:MAG: hypothetical protein EAZ92_08965 [Candidatus Kapaibacterium sp.]|nr:MAG: hypothetical protein EAZ92_08965 [Candidatus Kapabacteria bacterium]